MKKWTSHSYFWPVLICDPYISSCKNNLAGQNLYKNPTDPKNRVIMFRDFKPLKCLANTNIICGQSGDCPSGWMCTFENKSNGYATGTGHCKNCDTINVNNGCYKAGFETVLGTQECIKICTSGTIYLYAQ